MSKKILWAILALITAVPVAEARMGVGNGDGLKLVFAKAREHAAFITLRITDRSLAKSLDANLRDWILAHNQELAADIAKTQHKWIETETPACASTHFTTGSEIELSYVTCRDLGDFQAAGELLIHESVHHLDIADENFADAVALAIYSSWKSGGTDWVPTTKTGAPAARVLASTVNADGNVITFGGLTVDGDTKTATNTGAIYDPQADVWTPLPTANVAPRFGQQAIFSGSQMIVWGGFVVKADGGVAWQNNGAIYDLATNTWSTLRTPYGAYELNDFAPDVDWNIQSLVWTGKEAIIYGGSVANSKFPGGIYIPATRSWRPLAATNAPLRNAGQSAVWAEDRMIVWGGRDLNNTNVAQGASFDPVLNKWTTLATLNAPSPRAIHSAIWTGNSMVVFGGMMSDSAPDLSGTGGVYTPATNSWKSFRTEAVQARYDHTAVWTGSEMLVYGGRPLKLFRNVYFATVGAFNPLTLTWRTVEATSMPPARGRHSATWTGASMVVLAGKGDGNVLLNSGGVFYP